MNKRCKPTDTPQEKELVRSGAGTEMPNRSRNRFAQQPYKVTAPFLFLLTPAKLALRAHHIMILYAFGKLMNLKSSFHRILYISRWLSQILYFFSILHGKIYKVNYFRTNGSAVSSTVDTKFRKQTPNTNGENCSHVQSVVVNCTILFLAPATTQFIKYRLTVVINWSDICFSHFSLYCADFSLKLDTNNKNL